MAVLLLAYRSFEGNGVLRNADYLTHSVKREFQLFRYLLGGSLASVLVEKRAADLLYLCYGLYHVDGDTDSSCLICDSAGDSLSYPPCGIGRELISLGIVKLFDRLDKTEVALLYKIEELHTSADIALGDTYDKTQVSFGKALFGIGVALCHTLCELYLLFGGKQRDSSYLLKVYFYRVIDSDLIGRKRHIEVVVVCEVKSRVKVFVNGEIVDDIYMIGFNVVVELIYLLRVEVAAFEDIGDLLRGELSALLAVLYKFGKRGFDF